MPAENSGTEMNNTPKFLGLGPVKLNRIQVIHVWTLLEIPVGYIDDHLCGSHNTKRRQTYRQQAETKKIEGAAHMVPLSELSILGGWPSL